MTSPPRTDQSDALLDASLMHDRSRAPEAETELQQAMSAMPQIVWITDPAGYHGYFNEKWYEYTGMPRPGQPGGEGEVPQGWNWKEYLHPDDYDRAVEVWSRSLATGAHYEIEYRFREAATGRYRWFLGRALPLFDGAGRITRWFGTCTDIHDHRRAAERTARLHALTAALAVALTPAEVAEVVAEHASAAAGADGVVVLSTNTEGTSTEIASVRGDLDAALSPAEMLPCMDAIRSGQITVRSSEGWPSHGPTSGAVPSRRNDCVWIAVPLVAGGQTLGALGLIYRTELPSAEDQALITSFAQQGAQAFERARLYEAERRVRAEAELAAQVTNRIMAHLADGICLMDSEGRLTYMNPAAERITGWTSAELQGRVLHDAVHHLRPDGRPYPMSECPLGQVLSAGVPVLSLSDQWVRKDGSFVHVVTTCSPITDESGVAGAVLSLHDDTERRRAEAERERLLAEAQAANRAKLAFLANVSHELRTPLNAIGGHAQLLEMGIHGPVTGAQQDALERVDKAQRRLLGLINDLLNFAKLDAGRVDFDVRPTILSDVVREVVPLIEPQVRAKGLELRLDVPADDDTIVLADGEKLGQVLINLLSNAVKFTPVSQRDGSPGRITVDMRSEADAPHVVRLRVHDTGIGIPRDQQGGIFDPFVQVNTDLTRHHEGTGLGLAISRELVRGMEGELLVESEEGVGSTFTVVLRRGTFVSSDHAE